MWIKKSKCHAVKKESLKDVKEERKRRNILAIDARLSNQSNPIEDKNRLKPRFEKQGNR